jgi:RNA recognition motif-containing protein
MNIYVGNLSYNVQEDELRQAFEEYGQVSSVNIIKDRVTGDPRGFAFVEMPSDDEGRAAIDALNGADLGGRTLRIDEARPRERTGGGGGGRGGRGGFRQGGGGGRGGRGNDWKGY